MQRCPTEGFSVVQHRRNGRHSSMCAQYVTSKVSSNARRKEKRMQKVRPGIVPHIYNFVVWAGSVALARRGGVGMEARLYLLRTPSEACA
jgi:hypothetical protein